MALMVSLFAVFFPAVMRSRTLLSQIWKGFLPTHGSVSVSDFPRFKISRLILPEKKTYCFITRGRDAIIFM